LIIPTARPRPDTKGRCLARAVPERLVNRTQPDLVEVKLLQNVMRRQADLFGLYAPKVTKVDEASVADDVTESLIHEQRLANLRTLLEAAGDGQVGSEAGEIVHTDHRVAGPDAGPDAAPAAVAFPE
jgi:hypothetical protein